MTLRERVYVLRQRSPHVVISYLAGVKGLLAWLPACLLWNPHALIIYLGNDLRLFGSYDIKNT